MSVEYPISTVLDMALIPEPARSRMLAELPALLAQVAPVADKMVAPSEFTWVDDDLGQLTTTLVTTDGEHLAGPFVTSLADPAA